MHFKAEISFNYYNMGLKSSPHWHIKWRAQVGHTKKLQGPLNYFLLTHQVQRVDQPDFSPNNI